MTSWLRLVVAAACVAAAVGCAQPRPTVAPEVPPPLEVPVVPPRVLVPLPEEPPAVADDAPAEPRRPRPARPATRPDPAPAKPDPAPDTPAEPAPKPAEPPAPVLQTPQTVDDGEAARRVRDVLTRAERDLGRVNRASLGSDARTQFETARRFIDQAEGALKARNYVFASYLADKAEALARGLLGR